jgi:di/tricarboxylate transporter
LALRRLSAAARVLSQLRPWAPALLCVALIAFGALPVAAVPALLGSGLLWLLLATFVLAAVLQGSGPAERLALRVVMGAGSMAALCWRLTFFIAATAFVIPSTSARAALLMPVFAVLARVLAAPGPVRALALLFPTVILLSAGASLTGAGAHLIAADVIVRLGGAPIGFGRWAVLSAPFALAACAVATWLILHMFLHADERRARPAWPAPSCPPLTRAQRAVGAVTGLTVAGWLVAPALGVPLVAVAIGGALFATRSGLTGTNLPQALRQVDWRLLGLLAATMLMAQALLANGAVQAWLAGAAVALQAADIGPRTALLIAAVVAVLSHLVIVSRTARAMVLMPAVALPLSATGADAALLVLVCVQGSGFCQSFALSAKPVAIFARAMSPGGQGAFGSGDLLRLAVPLALATTGLLALFAFVVWPLQGLGH